MDQFYESILMTLFYDNKYTKWYYNIINNSKNNIIKKDEYYEDHHIIPRSLGGTDDKENIITLTAREHYICHLLLMKMPISLKHQYQMSCAFGYMSTVRNDYTDRRYNSKLYEYHKKLRSKIVSKKLSGKGNGMYGKKHTNKTKEKISKKRLSGQWEPNTPENNEKKRQRWMGKSPTTNPEIAAKVSAKLEKEYIITNPEGEEFKIKGLKAFCKQHNLNAGNILTWGHTKGWKCRPYFQNTINN